jgi:hypothetical protein
MSLSHYPPTHLSLLLALTHRTTQPFLILNVLPLSSFLFLSSKAGGGGEQSTKGAACYKLQRAEVNQSSFFRTKLNVFFKHFLSLFLSIEMNLCMLLIYLCSRFFLSVELDTFFLIPFFLLN